MKASVEFLKKVPSIFFASLIALSFQACGVPDDEASQLNQAKTGGGTGGAGKCEVTSGPNKGKTGTYDGEGWCVGDWGGTECTGSDGASKCKDLAKVVIVKPVIVKPIRVDIKMNTLR